MFILNFEVFDNFALWKMILAFVFWSVYHYFRLLHQTDYLMLEHFLDEILIMQSTGGFFAAARLSGATPPPAHVLSRSIGMQASPAS